MHPAARRALSAAVALVTATALPTTARAASFTFPDFSSTPSLTLNGSAASVATKLDGAVLRVAPAAPALVGSAFTNASYNLAAGFSTFFTFRLNTFDTTTAVNGAEGLTFTLQNDPRGAAALGDPGATLGYAGANPIANSAAVEFDDALSSPQDFGPSHVALDLNGSVLHSATPGTPTYPANVAADLHNLRVFSTWIDYDGANLAVRLSNNGLRPSTPTLSVPLTLAAGPYRVGFTASTGVGSQNDDVLSWSFTDAYSPYAGGAFPADGVVAPTNAFLWSSPSTWTNNQVPTNITNVYLNPTAQPYIIYANADARAQTVNLVGDNSGPTRNDCTLFVAGGATLAVAESVNVAYLNNGYASLNVSGAGSAVDVYGNVLIAGNSNSTGILNLSSGARLTDAAASLAQGFTGCYASVVVDGAGTQWTNRGDLRVGYLGSADMTISNGAHVSALNAYVGIGGFSTLNLRNPGSRLETARDLYVGGGYADGNYVTAQTAAAVAVHRDLFIRTGAAVNLYSGSTLTVDGNTAVDGNLAISGNSTATLNTLTGSAFSAVGLFTASTLTATSLRAATVTVDATSAIHLRTSSSPHAPTTSTIGYLGLTTGGTLDLGDNYLTIDDTYDPASLPNTIRLNLLAARSGGAWTGTGITSAAARDNPSLTTAVGDVPAAQLLNLTGFQTASWHGVTVSATAVLLAYTYYGDANLDGKLDAADYALLDRGFAKHLTGWLNGDFNYDNTITAADYLLIDHAYLLQGAPLSPDFIAQRESEFGPDYVATLLTSLPEPALLCCLPPLLLPRRRSTAKMVNHG